MVRFGAQPYPPSLVSAGAISGEDQPSHEGLRGKASFMVFLFYISALEDN